MDFLVDESFIKLKKWVLKLIKYIPNVKRQV